MLSRIDSSKHDHNILKEIRVGKSKDALDTVGDHSITVEDVTNNFGCFIKFRITKEVPEQPIVINAFTRMLEAQRDLARVRYPPPVSARNKKDEMYNDILIKEIQSKLE